MNTSIQQIAIAHDITYNEAEEFCRAVFRHFLGQVVPKYSAVAAEVVTNPTASATVIAGRLRGTKTNGTKANDTRNSTRRDGTKRDSTEPDDADTGSAGPAPTPAKPSPVETEAPEDARVPPSTREKTTRTSSPSKKTRRRKSSFDPHDMMDDRDHETWHTDTNSRLPKNRLRDENRITPDKAKKCPHGVPYPRRCRICQPDDFG